LAPVTSYGGNLIATLDFFRHGAKYYKVTEKVDVAGLGPADVARLDFPARLVLLKTVAHSLKILHDVAIVHSDLKPSNVLIKRTERGYTTKLIDFDSSYVVGNPPPPEEIVGTMDYYSPELVRYIQGAAAGSELTTKSDIFALGLIYAEYLSGAPPAFDPAHHEAAIAVLHGTVLRLPPVDLPAPVVALVERMLLADPAARPMVGEVHAILMGLRNDAPPTTPSVLRTSRSMRRTITPRVGRRSTAPGGPEPGSTLRGKGLRLVAERARSAAGRPPPARGRGLLGKLAGKLEERLSR
jgi:serine/threonine protein kinase